MITCFGPKVGVESGVTAVSKVLRIVILGKCEVLYRIFVNSKVGCRQLGSFGIHSVSGASWYSWGGNKFPESPADRPAGNYRPNTR